MGEDLAETSPKGVKVLALDSHNLQTVTGEGLREVVALHVLGRVAGNGNIVVIDDKLDVEVLRDSQSGSLRIVTFLDAQCSVRHTCVRV